MPVTLPFVFPRPPLWHNVAAFRCGGERRKQPLLPCQLTVLHRERKFYGTTMEQTPYYRTNDRVYYVDPPELCYLCECGGRASSSQLTKTLRRTFGSFRDTRSRTLFAHVSLRIHLIGSSAAGSKCMCVDSTTISLPGDSMFWLAE